jgi:hypothetical protein
MDFETAKMLWTDSNRIRIISVRKSRSDEKKYMTASEFDEMFDSGGDLSAHYHLENASRPGLEQRRVSVDFPVRMVEKLDREAGRLEVTRQSVIKVFISEKLKEENL